MKKYLSVVILLVAAVSAVTYLNHASRTPSPHDAKAAGNTLYVSPAGSGTSCTDANPCSLETGMSQTDSGDTLILKDGTYTTVNDGTFPALRFEATGTSETNRVLIKAQNFRKAVIDCTETGGVDFAGDWIQVENIKFYHCGVGFGLHTRFQGIEVGYAWGNSFGGPEASIRSFTEFIDVYVHHSGLKSDTEWWPVCDPDPAKHTGSGDCHAIYNGSDDILIDGGVWTGPVFSIHARFTPERWIIRNVTFTSDPNMGGGCIIFQSGGNNIVYNNIFQNMKGCGVFANSNNTKIYNNTFYNVEVPIIIESTGNIASNNLFANSGGPFEVRGGDYMEDRNLITRNAGFINPSTGDFHLIANSPAIDAGMTLPEVTTDAEGKTRPAGNAIDIGAYEYGAIGGSPKPSGIPLPSSITTPGKTTPYPTPTIFYLTPVFECLGACPTIPPTPTPIDQGDNPDDGGQIQKPPAEEEPPSDETIEAPGEDTGEEDTTPEEPPTEEQPDVSDGQTGSNALQQLLGLIAQLIQAILKLFFPI